jgi:hypothetical protein
VIVVVHVIISLAIDDLSNSSRLSLPLYPCLSFHLVKEAHRALARLSFMLSLVSSLLSSE